jgi:hypothetical protein
MMREKLADVVLEEADPGMWPGAGQPLAEVDQKTRGDRYWCKKNAAATFSLLERAIGLADRIKRPEGESDEGADIDKQIAAAERKAAQLLDKMTSAGKKAAFDKRVHGKA